MLCTVVISTNFHAKYGNKACKLCIQGLLYLLTLSRVKSRHFFKHLKLRMVFFCLFFGYTELQKKHIYLSSYVQVMMLRAKFGRINIWTNLLQRFDNNFGHFYNKFCYKAHKTIYDFSNEIADCCSIRLATLP